MQLQSFTDVRCDESESVFEVARVVHVDVLGQVLCRVRRLLLEIRSAGSTFPELDQGVSIITP